MKNVLLMISLAGIILVTSCSKKNNDSTPSTPIYLLTVYKIAGANDSTVYSYDAANRMVEITYTYTKSDTKFSYDNNGHLTEVDVYLNGVLSTKNVYSYSNNIINQLVTNYVNGSASGVINYVITLNSNQQVIKRDMGPNGVYIYTYDQLGNITAFNVYQNPNSYSPMYNYTFTFDNNKSRFLNVKGDYYIYSTLVDVTNNVLTQNTSFANGTVQTYTYAYTYNSAGFPVSRVLTSAGSSAQTQVFGYIVK